MMKIIQLQFEKSQTRLAGFPYGEITFKNQVKTEIGSVDDMNEQIKIVFPSQIEKVASSFVQGFFAELINTIGYDKIESLFVIETADEQLTQRIRKNIY